MSEQLLSARIKLIPANIELIEALLSGSPGFGELLGATIPDEWSTFGMAPFQYTLENLKKDPSRLEWPAYFIVHRGDNILIGSCGYKNNPDETGITEIGYEIKAEYRNQGLATETARLLIQRAWSFASVNTVLAHTLAEINPSVKVLQKCGMAFVDSIADEEEGEIWQWKIERLRPENPLVEP